MTVERNTFLKQNDVKVFAVMAGLLSSQCKQPQYSVLSSVSLTVKSN